MSSMLRYFGITALTFGATAPLQASPSVSGFEDCPVVADHELDQMRGGFDASNGGPSLSFSFGIERATFLNGELVSTTTVAIPTYPSVMDAKVAQTVISSTTNIIQNGLGNSFALPSVRNLPTAVTTVIQNTLDNQVISNATVINASVTSRNFINSLAIQTSLNQMVFRSLR